MAALEATLILLGHRLQLLELAVITLVVAVVRHIQQELMVQAVQVVAALAD
jgi:hypothetical protein